MTDEELDDAVTLLALRGLKTTTTLPYIFCYCGGELGKNFCSQCGVDRETSESISRLTEKAWGFDSHSPD